jgi:hypothetical protein
MPFQYPSSGQNNVAEYQASGLPYVTHSQVAAGTVNQISFPFVANVFNIKNNSSGILRVGFTRNGVLGTNYFSLPVSGAFEAKIRITDLFVTAEAGTLNYEVVAGLTSIVPTNFFILTGSYVGFSGSTISPINSRYYGYDGIG